MNFTEVIPEDRGQVFLRKRVFISQKMQLQFFLINNFSDALFLSKICSMLSG